MNRVAYEAIGPCKKGTNNNQHSIVIGGHIFKPELECIAVLVHYMGASVEKKDLVLKMIGCDFHLDAIEKVKDLSNNEFQTFKHYISETLLNQKSDNFVGYDLLEEFREHCE